MQDWRAFSKVELHRHLEGSVRLQTILDVASEAGVELGSSCRTVEGLRQHACVLTPVKDLSTMLRRMGMMQSVLATPAILERVAFEACEDAFLDGVRLLELRYSPGFIKMGHASLTIEKIHEAIVAGVSRFEKQSETNFACGLIGIITREQSVSEAHSTTDFVINNRETFVGLDLAGDEAHFASRDFEKFFVKAKAAGLGITVHSGESFSDDAHANVRDSIERLGATRIGHGIQITRDRSVLDFVARSGAVLEVCPTSNVLTGAVSSLQDHPLSRLMSAGVRVTLNSDDPTFFGISLSSEYALLSRTLSFSTKEFKAMNQVAEASSFVPHEKRTKIQFIKN